MSLNSCCLKETSRGNYWQNLKGQLGKMSIKGTHLEDGLIQACGVHTCGHNPWRQEDQIFKVILDRSYLIDSSKEVEIFSSSNICTFEILLKDKYVLYWFFLFYGAEEQSQVILGMCSTTQI